MRIEIDEQVTLRAIRLRDAEPIFALVASERSRLDPWLPWVDSTHETSDVQTFIEGALAHTHAGTGQTVVIEYAGAISGVIGLDAIDAQNHAAEIGYWISERAEGLGLVTRGVAAIAAHAFHQLALERLVLRIAVDNSRSRAVAERLGFVQDGTVRSAERHRDGFRDLVSYSLLASEYQERVK